MKKINIISLLGFVFMSLAQVNIAHAVTAPVINSLSVTSGPVGIQVTIVGTGFTEEDNKIKFGNTGTENSPSYILPSVSSVSSTRTGVTNNTRTITFNVPSYSQSCEAPTGADCMPGPVGVGIYKVSVINSNGTSNGVDFTVTEIPQATSGGIYDVNLVTSPSNVVLSMPFSQEAVLGFKIITKTGSDIDLKNIKITFVQKTGSISLNDSIRWVSVWQDREIIGSLSSSSLFKDGSIYVANVPVSSILKSNTTYYFSVKVDSPTTVLSSSDGGSSYNISIDNVSFTDGTNEVSSIVVSEVLQGFSFSGASYCPSGYTSNGSTCVPNATATIKVLSPNGGEVYRAGQKITIKWESKNIPSTHKVNFQLWRKILNTSGGPTNGLYMLNPIGIYGAVMNSGSVEMIIPSQTVSDSTYLIELSGSLTGEEGSGFIDYSDNTFTITNSTTSCSTGTYWNGTSCVINPYPDGCTSNTGYSSTTGASCGHNNTVSSIGYLSQSSGSIGTLISIYGYDFTQTGNIIKFKGNGVEGYLNKTINGLHYGTPGNFYGYKNLNEFKIPSFLQPCVPDFVGSCITVTYPVKPGLYKISVVNRTGTSNEIDFRVTDSMNGCLNGEKYSSTNGQLCDNSTVYPPGCNSIYGYSSTTGQPCSTVVVYPNSECSLPKFTKILRYGTRNSQVDALQSILVDKGFFNENFATGLFNSATRTAVKTLQKTNGLFGDGIVGPKTRVILNSLWTAQCFSEQESNNN